MDLLSFASGLIPIIEKLKQASDKVADVQVKELFAELQNMATTARLEAMKLKEENINLREQNMELNSKLTLRESLKQKPSGLYYRESNPDFLLCPRCYETTGNTLTLLKGTWYGQIAYSCPQCEKHYKP